MTNDLEFETDAPTGKATKEWGMHNGVVVLAALGLVALSTLLQWIPQTQPFEAVPIFVLDFLSSVGFVLTLSAGTVIGMLVATRMLQAHVSPRGARMLALWGVAALIASAVLQAGFLSLRITWQTEPAIPTVLAITVVQYVFSGTMAVGAAMIALAFVGRLRT